MNPLVERYVKLSDLLAKCEEIKRAIKLPHGAQESDSHHAFSLALIAYDVCQKYELDLDVEKVVLYALVHDLLEIITGDEVTLMMSYEQLKEKRDREKSAIKEFKILLRDYPDLLQAYDEFEKLDNVESATVFVLDKTCTIWSHFHDGGDNLFNNGVKNKTDIETWYENTKKKIKNRIKAEPSELIYELFDKSYIEMRDNLVKGAE